MNPVSLYSDLLSGKPRALALVFSRQRLQAPTDCLSWPCTDCAN